MKCEKCQWEVQSQCIFGVWLAELVLCKRPEAVRSWQVVSCDRPLRPGYIYGKIMEWQWRREKVPVNYSEVLGGLSLRPGLQ